MGHVFLSLCMLCEFFVVENWASDYYNALTLEIRFAPVLGCAVFLFVCLLCLFCYFELLKAVVVCSEIVSKRFLQGLFFVMCNH